MGKETSIEWCDSTVNPTTGCDGCELWPGPQESYPDAVHRKARERLETAESKVRKACYAAFLHEGRLSKAMPDLYAEDFTEVRLAPGRMAAAAAWSDLTGKDRPDKPWLNGKPRHIFVGDMGDIFSKAVPFEYLESELIDVATGKQGRRHIWMTLTKQPRRMVEFQAWLEAKGKPWPTNVWTGTSVTRQANLKSRYDQLVQMNAVRFLSVEPMLEPIDFYGVIDDIRVGYCNECGRRDRLLDREDADCRHCGSICVREGRCGVDLVIFGGESDQSGQKGRPFNLAWLRTGLRQFEHVADRFVKQLGSHPYDSDAARDVPGADDHVDPNCVTDADVTVFEAVIEAMAVRLADSHGGDPTEWPEDFRVRSLPTVRSTAVNN